MKKLLFVLFAVAAIFTSCQKETGNYVKITPEDVGELNVKLRGTWVFPVQTLSILDNTGKPLKDSENVSAPAYQFDGNSKVTLLIDPQTTQQATYALSTDKGLIYLTLTYEDGTEVKYQVLQVDDHTLKLNSTQDYVYYGPDDNPASATAISNIILQRQSSADVTGHLVRVTAQSDSSYNMSVYVTHAGIDTAVLLDNKENAIGPYSFSFVAKKGDHLTVDIFGNPKKIIFNAYYNGLPLLGDTDIESNEILTSEGWNIE